MTTPFPKRIKEIEEREKAATEGPWKGHRSTDKDGRWLMGIDMVNDQRELPDYHWINTDREPGSDWHNCEFIAHSRSDIPFLLEAVKKMKEGLEFYASDDASSNGVYGCSCCESTDFGNMAKQSLIDLDKLAERE